LDGESVRIRYEEVVMASYSPQVLSDVVVPRFDRIARTLSLVLGGAVLVGLCAQVAVPVPGTPVPVTGQTFAVMLVSAALGWQRAAVAMLLYAAVGVAGMPWFADGRSGWTGPTMGYIAGFVVAAVVVGWLASRGGDRTPPRTLLTMVAGTIAIYAVGVPLLAYVADLSFATALTKGATPFLVGDGLKVLLAAGLLPRAWKWVQISRW
jgi:biotin transport system substrate-specific component